MFVFQLWKKEKTDRQTFDHLIFCIVFLHFPTLSLSANLRRGDSVYVSEESFFFKKINNIIVIKVVVRQSTVCKRLPGILSEVSVHGCSCFLKVGTTKTKAISIQARKAKKHLYFFFVFIILNWKNIEFLF